MADDASSALRSNSLPGPSCQRKQKPRAATTRRAAPAPAPAAPAEPEGATGDEEAEEAEEAEQSGRAKREGADVSRVTDFVEQKELDSSKATQALAAIAAEDAQSAADAQAEALREKELAAVAIDAADVDMIVEQMELDRDRAERTLREHKGDVVAALNALVTAA